MPLLFAKLVDEAEQRAAEQRLLAEQSLAEITLKDGSKRKVSSVESVLHARAAAELQAFARELREACR